MKNPIHFYLQKAVLSAVLTVIFLAPVYSAEQATISAKDDYITCWKQPCVHDEGIDWSIKHANGVAISVRMGKKAAVTDDQIKQILTADLKHYGVENVKFFFENFDGNSSAIALHVRGGVEGIFGIDTVRDKIKNVARRAKNTNPLFSPN